MLARATFAATGAACTSSSGSPPTATATPCCCALGRTTATAKRQTLRLGSVAEHLVVTGDHARLRQVLVNLIGNAVKFTPAGGSIGVTTSTIGAGDSGWGEVRVTDSGPGIAEAEQAAIFEPYYRSEGTAAVPGVGLGLAISRALVKQMGGEMLLQSQVGTGSAFAIRLPLKLRD